MCTEETTDGYDVILSGPIRSVPDYALRFAKAYVQQRQRACARRCRYSAMSATTGAGSASTFMD